MPKCLVPLCDGEGQDHRNRFDAPNGEARGFERCAIAADALHCQRETCELILAHGGDYGRQRGG